MPSSDMTSPGIGTAPRLAERAATRLIDRDATRDLAALASGTCLQGAASDLAGRSVLVATRAQRKSALALVELDGLVRRMVIAPPDLNPEHLSAIVEDAQIEAVVCDEPARFEALGLPLAPIADTVAPAGASSAHARHPMGTADIRHAGAAQDGRAHAGRADRRDRRTAARRHRRLVDLLRHPPLRRPADVPARAARAHRLRAHRRVRAAGRSPASARRSRRHRDVGHAVALAARADEQRARLVRAALRAPLRRDLGPDRARWPSQRVPGRRDRACLCLDGSRCRLHGRGRARRLPRRLPRARGCSRDEGRGRHAAHQVGARGVLLSRRHRARS